MASDFMAAVPCNICDNPTAIFYCNTCEDALCPICKEHHEKSKGHEVVPYAEKEDPKYYANVCCATHKAKAAEYWCDTCDVSICGLCITKKHKGHVFCMITTIVSEKRKAMQFETNIIRNKTICKWEEILQQIRKITSEFQDNIDKIAKKLVARAAEMHKEVDAILFQSQRTLKEVKTLGLSKLQKQEKYVTDRLQQYKSDVNKYENQLKDTDQSALLQFKEGSMQSKAKLPSFEISTVFIKGENDTSAMQKIFGELSAEGIRVSKGSALNTTKVINKSKEKDQSTSNEETSDSSKTESIQTNSASSNAQKSLIPEPTVESEFLVDNHNAHIAIVQHDLAWIQTGFRSVQMMNSDGSVRDEIRNNSNITDITLSLDGDLLFTDASSNIKLVSKQKEITTLFELIWQPTGLCSLPNNDLLVAFGRCGKVKVFNNEGIIRHNLDHIKFRYPWRVAVNKVNSEMYVSDHEKFGCTGRYWGKVIAIGADQQLRYEYSGQGEHKICPQGVCTDQMGHVLITDYNKHCVHILDQDGQFIRYLLTSNQGLYKPMTIDVDSNSHVWVGRCLTLGKGQVKVVRYLQ